VLLVLVLVFVFGAEDPDPRLLGGWFGANKGMPGLRLKRRLMISNTRSQTQRGIECSEESVGGSGLRVGRGIGFKLGLEFGKAWPTVYQYGMA
jgi:hypothetical protein